jgi:hypothetical protein
MADTCHNFAKKTFDTLRSLLPVSLSIIMSDAQATHSSQHGPFSFFRRWLRPKNLTAVSPYKGRSLPTTTDPLSVGLHGPGGIYDPFSSLFRKV